MFILSRNVSVGLAAGVVQEIHETVQRSLVGLLIPADRSSTGCHRVCPGGEGGDGELADACVIRAFCVRDTGSDGIHGIKTK